MRSPTLAPPRPWQATLIFTLVGAAVVASAATGWWYARESTPHQGPIVLISVDGLRPADLGAYGGAAGTAPAIDALSADAVVFERAYAHSPLTLPAHASILAGQLPFEHGVRDETGFTLKDEARSLPELLRNRGFETGAAVSSFLLRPESGVAQGFSFFDAETPQGAPTAPVLVRDGLETADAAERWLRSRRGHRFMLFIQVDEATADSAVTRLVEQLKARDLYEQATIVLTADRAESGDGLSLDEAALRVPLLVKQPESEGAGRRIAGPVQHIDLLPTVLDLVRAPIPSGLRGRSLRAVLDGDDQILGNGPIYAETLAAQFRFGGRGKFSLVTPTYRYIRGGRDEVIELGSGAVRLADDAPEAVALRTELEELIEQQHAAVPQNIPPANEDLFAAIGYLGGGLLFDASTEPLDPGDEAWLVETHQAAAMLASQKDYPGAIAQLRQIARGHPRMAVVQYQLGTLLARMGRFDEARSAFGAAAEVEPDNPHVPIAAAAMLLRARQPQQAQAQIALAIALAEHGDAQARTAAYEMAVRVALAAADFGAAETHAEAAQRDDPATALMPFVRGQSLYAVGRYEDALAAFEEAADAATAGETTLRDLHLHLGQTLARLDRFEEAEEQYRAEIRVYPRNIAAYSSLVSLYEASNRGAAAEEILDQLVASVPTPEAYETAASLWTVLGEPARAAAVRADARARFRTAQPVARIARGEQR
jgi:tetratricopeptide (TPR) repeat protein